MTERNQFIDFLRGFSIIVMILTHTTVFFPHDKVASILWNYSQFAVPVFLFCSSYLFLLKNIEKPVSLFSYLKKRLLRLLVPYYVFLFFFLISLLLVSPHIVTVTYILQSMVLIGGVDINWLVLLFLYITVMLPFFAWSFKKSSILFWTFFIISFGSTVFLLFEHLNISYKLIMWLPWATMLYFTFIYIKHENKKIMLFLLFVLSCLLFSVSDGVQNILQHSLVLQHNKYPPNLFYITYGTSVILFLSFFSTYLVRNKVVTSIINFFSQYSYSIFFLHYIILTVLAVYIKQLQLTWYILFIIVLVSTALLQYLFNTIRGRFFKN